MHIYITPQIEQEHQEGGVLRGIQLLNVTGHGNRDVPGLNQFLVSTP